MLVINDTPRLRHAEDRWRGKRVATVISFKDGRGKVREDNGAVHSIHSSALDPGTVLYVHDRLVIELAFPGSVSWARLIPAEESA